MSHPLPQSLTWGSTIAGEVAVTASVIVGRLSQKQAVRVATTANVTIASALNAGDTIDGVTLAAGDRVLVKDQTAQAENGIYEAGTSPVRTGDFDDSDEILGALVPVIAGTVNAGTLFRNTNTAPITVDTDDITFELVGAGTSIPFDHGNMGASETLDLGDSDWHRGTLDADCTITVQGFTVDRGAILVFECMQDGTGGHGITWDPDIVWSGNDQPDQTAGATTIFVLVTSQGDSLIYGAIYGQGAIALSELTDVSLTSPAAGDRLRFDGTAWVNTRRVWMPLTTVVAGTPDLVWDGDDSLIPTEVPT